MVLAAVPFAAACAGDDGGPAGQDFDLPNQPGDVVDDGEDIIRGSVVPIDGEPVYMPDQVLVSFRTELDDSDMALAAAEVLPAASVRRIGTAFQGERGRGLAVVSFRPGVISVEEAIEALEATGAVDYAEPDYMVKVNRVPNDSSYSRLWGMDKIDAPEAWDVNTGSREVLVTVIDTGIDWNHPDLAGNIWTNPGEIPGNGVDDDGNGYVDDIHGWNAIANNGHPMDDHSHGTHCAGTVGGVGNNGQGVAGVAWEVRMAAGKFLGGSGGGSYSDAIEVVNYSTAIGSDITSNSWGGFGYSRSLHDAFIASANQGVVHVAAAGNSNHDNDGNMKSYPCAFEMDDMICVAASDSMDRRASFSSYGRTTVDVAAPGVGIYSTVLSNRYASYSGTSMATPHVAGILALLKSQDLQATKTDLKSWLYAGVDQSPTWSALVATGGRVNVARSMSFIRVERPTAPSGVELLPGGAGDLQVSWSRVAEPDIAGYKVYYGTASGDYGPPGGVVDVGDVTTHRLTGLGHGQTWFVTVVSYLSNGTQSRNSDEVNALVADTTAPGQVIDLSFQAESARPIPASVESSSGFFGDGFEAWRALDGDLSTGWTAPLRSELRTEQLMVRVAANEDDPATVSAVRLYAQSGLARYFPRGFELRTSVDGVAWDTVMIEAGYQATGGQWDRWAFPAVEARFVELRITDPVKHESNLYYAAIGELELHGDLGSLDGRLVWTAPGDNNHEGQADSYEIRYSVDPPGENIAPWFVAADRLDPVPAPATAGTEQQTRVPGLRGETRYFAALLTRDAQSNSSAISNVAELRTPGIAPGTISDLSAVALDTGGVALTWSAVGDDGLEGRAALYEVRVAESPITASSFTSATPVAGAPLPAASGSAETFAVPPEALRPNKHTWFAVRVLDEQDNASGVAVTSVRTRSFGDNIPPAQVLTLTAAHIGATQANALTPTSAAASSTHSSSWTASMATDADPNTAWASAQSPDGEGFVETLTLDYGRVVGVDRVSAAASPDLPGLFPSDFTVSGSADGLSWSTLVTAFDFRAPAGGEAHTWLVGANELRYLRLEAVATRAPAYDLPAWVMVAELTAWEARTSPQSLGVSWVAVGDDDDIGTASAYDLRIATTPITPETFQTAERVTTPPPQLAGSLEGVRVDGLEPESRYYFALIVEDHNGNRSPMSNIPDATTPASPPAAVSDLVGAVSGSDSVALSWTAVGDDGTQGQATSYDLRRSDEPITAENFEQAERVTTVPAPKPSGEQELVTVGNLAGEITHHFALKVIDDFGGVSPISNAISVAMPDLTAPDAPLNVTIAPPQNGVASPVTLAHVSNSGENSEATGGAAAVDENDTTVWITPRRTRSQTEQLVAAIGSANAPSTAAVGRVSLTPSSDYANLFPVDFEIQLSTDGQNWTRVAGETGYAAEPGVPWDVTFNEQSANRVRLLVTTPAETDGNFFVAVAELTLYATEAATDRLTVGFISPGDDGTSGTPASYQIRYGTSPVNTDNWETMTPLNAPPTVEGGLPRSVPASGLNAETTYHFGIRALDEAGNVGAIGTGSGTTLTAAPTRVEDLAATATGHTTIDLSWSAPTDGDGVSAVTRYDIRFATSAITELNWEVAQAVDQSIVPKAPDSAETLTVSGLTPDVTYHFALKSIDDAGSISSLSSGASAHTIPLPEAVPPARVTNLAATTWDTEDGAIYLSWTAPGDDGTVGQAASYDLRYATTPITSNNFESATRVTGMNTPRTGGSNEGLVVRNLDNEQVYFFALKAADEIPNVGEMSNVATAQTREVPPAQVTNLRVMNFADSSVTLAWNTTGDDGNEGQAASFEMRYGTSSLNEGNWNGASVVTQMPTPGPAGSGHEVVIDGLTGDTTYFFGLKVVDGRDNESSISNVPSQRTADGTPPGRIGDLRLSSGPTADAVYASFSAPGDNGYTGDRAVEYEMRWATVPLNENNFASGTRIMTSPPQSIWQQEVVAMAGLPVETAIFVAVRAKDDANNWGELSASVGIETGEMPPASVTDLTVLTADYTELVIAWTAVGDSGNEGTATSYDLRYSDQPFNDTVWDGATQVEGEPRPQSAGSAETFVISGLVSDTTYYLGLKVIDARGNVSAISNLPSGTTLDDVPPAQVTNLGVRQVEGSPRSLEITWTSVGDDGNEGTASSYELRYSTSAITEGNFRQASRLPVVPTPSRAGVAERAFAQGLLPEQTYHFALIVEDASGNRSPMSNVPSGTTGDEPPGAVSDLRTGTPTTESLTLTWTAPGDNGPDGRAASYLVRYSADSGVVARWDDATPVENPPTPGDAGTPESLTVSGLTPNTVYYFAVRATDSRGNLGALSNIAFDQTSDPDPPAAITDLTAETGFGTGTVTLTWTAPGDDGNTGRATRYELRYATSPITDEAEFGNATEVQSITAPRSPGLTESLTLAGLENETTYYVSIRTYDEADNESPLSNSPGASTAMVPPSRVTGLNAGNRQESSLTVSWTATGDDGSTGTASSYDLRYATFMITDENFGAATRVNNLPDPQAPGAGESVTVGGLSADTRYYFALQVYDDQSNSSGLSNVATEATLDVVAPNAVESLRAQPPPENGAPLRASVAEVSGQYSSAWRRGYATDNNLSTAWATPARREPTEEYILLDLGASQTVGELLLHPARGYEQLFPTDFTIELGEDPLGLEVVREVVGHEVVADSWSRFEVEPQRARFLRITTTSTTSHLGFYYVMFAEAAVREAPSRRDVIRLNWFATGDDGFDGQASGYELRYSTEEITEGNFSQAELAPGTPAPGVAGVIESFEVSGLTGETPYYFALVVVDEEGNGSELSNVATAETLPVPPGTITDLVATPQQEAPGTVDVSWTNTGDDGDAGVATQMFFRYATTPIDDVSWENATDYPIAEHDHPLEAGTPQSNILAGLPTGTTLYLRMRVADEHGLEGPLSNEVVIVVPDGPDAIAPSAVDSLTARHTAEGDGEAWAVSAHEASGQQFPDFGMDQVADGNPGTDFATPASRADGTAFVTVSLDTPAEVEGQSGVLVGEVWLRASQTFGELFPTDFVVEVSDNEADWTELFSSNNLDYDAESETDEAGDPFLRIRVSEPVVASFLRVRARSLESVAGFFQLVIAEITVRAPAADRGTVSLSWVAPGDDGSDGTATSYEIVYSRNEITEGNFDDATPWPGDVPTPQAAGALEGVTVSGFDPFEFYFAVRATDEAGNTSAISNVAYVGIP